MNRDGLGDLWIPWYVHRSDPRRPFADIQVSSDDAQQLRVRDVGSDQRVWDALTVADRNRPELSHARVIERYERRYRDSEIAVFVAPAWVVGEALVLYGGVHRACALYRLAPSILDVSVIECEPQPGCPDVQRGPRSTTLG